jgi:hypothetical protein
MPDLLVVFERQAMPWWLERCEEISDKLVQDVYISECLQAGHQWKQWFVKDDPSMNERTTNTLWPLSLVIRGTLLSHIPIAAHYAHGRMWRIW